MKVLITGSASGIGLACAQLFAMQHHTVVGIDLVPMPVVLQGYTHHIADVRGPLPSIDGVQVLVTAAGVALPDRDAIGVNLMGTVRCVEQYAMQPAIRSVVTVASASAHNGAEFPLYSASKGGVLAYTKNVALRLATYGATANSISPGGVLTASNAPVLDDPDLCRRAMAETLLHKWATADEIAQWIYFLAVVNTSATGQDIVVDNGEMLRSNFIWPTA